MKNIPEKIKDYIKDKHYITDNIGLSSSKIFIFDDMVLKTEEYSEETDKTVEMIKWMSGQLPVPEIICYTTQDNISYILMSKIKGKMACDEYYMEQSEKMIGIIADGLKMLWNTDITDCPREITTETDLENAEYNLENGKVDLDAVDYQLLNKSGIKDCYQLIKWLRNNIPEYEPVLSHGDYCLPNVFIKDDRLSGFIDLGEAAVSDKWKDIALCYISLKNNFSGVFGGKSYPDFNPDILFEKLNISPDWTKLNFWFLLNELYKLK